ncbi:S-receptor-like serine/threonine-protein kinase protein [Dioscorea alata]|uniref:S-receptor-like serine/threonine-protein kinase protein n=1 Tax=Dioscorea alata TaxID=55571 RepID=A0ACB7VUL2_DIOAL|nr:S-receptor-like serine/threonine-protein kinase protein [Dioscorea alata]
MENSPALLTIILFLVISLFVVPFASPCPQSSLLKGSSLSVEKHSDILVSPDESFAFGFHRISNNAYSLSIWFANSNKKTIAWTANRDYLVNGLGSRVTLRKDGALVLTDVDDTVVWSSNTSLSHADQAQLLDNGNLVIKDPQGNVLWQSFDSPTDTLLPTQPITKNKKLVSSMPGGSVSSGYYSFYFDNDNVMKLTYKGPQVSGIYWPNPDYNIWQNGRYNYNSSRYAVLDESGPFQSSDRLSFGASDMGVVIKRRLTLDYDGNLRLYSLNNSTGLWSVSWEALPNLCNVHGLCGRNGICVYDTQKPMCACPFGYEVSALGDWSEGCKPKFNISCEDSQQLRFVELKKTDFWGFDLNYTPSVALGACLELCQKDCSCLAVSYKMGSGDCFTKSALFNGRTAPDFPGNIYLKLPLNLDTSDLFVLQVHKPICNATGATVAAPKYAEITGSRTKWTYFFCFISAFGVIEIFFIVFGWWFVNKRGTKPTLMEEGYKLIASQFRRFTYKELKKATGNYKNKLERGGSRAVYKGVLEDERTVAVEKLDDIISTKDFWAEVGVIARINHMNLVRIWGFCCERSHRFLVSEFMENGSLDNHLFVSDHSSANLLGWKERFHIAVGVARGLAYLHHECLEWVIHCDVKPENILLDSDFEPKITDFGLAMLADRRRAHSKISKVRGSRGYMAPEWALNLPITARVDVYSYGVVLLELLMGSRASDWKKMDGDDEEEEAELELLGLVRMLKVKLGGAEDSWIDDLADARLAGQFNHRQAAVMVEMAISCLEEDRIKRPNMDTVAEILNGHYDEPYCHGDHSYSTTNLE